ncbi:5-oxoprolinase subunit PxpA [Marinomonas sp. C2222]|uniref:5-oxoprolinase subunit PxpA n=1 Tax=Marinomonas sargassi TaxID=2984494 RepID=A0ABT2YSV6_9GAMM|nr:5-oxoprolinase subunit PxpA [Marinomonas sargassi]MCV2402979.1 5-oxoprolinase subunit PxpA [Marinomonas sargassi]
MKLNCDLGESYGSWKMGLDSEAMSHIDQANIACGFHAGDPQWMIKTLLLAKQHNVEIGAHPGYPDLVGFGRRSMKCSAEEVQSLVQYQMSALDGMARCQGLEMTYIKPHGALYNDMMADAFVRENIMKAVANYYRPVRLVLQATPSSAQHKEEAEKFGLEVAFEAFADRCYDDDGRLLARSKAGAVHTKEKMLAQVKQLMEQGTVTTVSGIELALQVDTLCVHGDNEEGVRSIEAIKVMVAGQ